MERVAVNAPSPRAASGAPWRASVAGKRTRPLALAAEPLAEAVGRTRQHAERAGLGLAYSHVRRTANVLDTLMRTGADTATRRAAARALDSLYAAEDELARRRAEVA